MMTPLAGTAKHDRHRKRARRLGRILFRSGSVSVALNILLFWAVVAVAAPLLSPYDPTTIDFTASLDPSPSAAHWLGTDATGRDLLSRIIWGARTTFLVVPLSVLSAFAVGRHQMEFATMSAMMVSPPMPGHFFMIAMAPATGGLA